jgi:hypothetical protein
MEEPEEFTIKRGLIMLTARPKLQHGSFWDKMDKATRQVDRWPEWVKGSPENRGHEAPPERKPVISKATEIKSTPR